MSRLVVAALLAVGAALGLAGCGTGRAADAFAGRGTAIADPNEPQPSAAAQRSVTGIPGLRLALEQRVIAAAGVVRPVTSTCDTPTAILPVFDCQVTYLGQTVTYHVKTTPDGPQTYTWEASTDAMVASRVGIEEAMWRGYANRASAINCDADLPEVQRVPAGKVLGQRCYFKPIVTDKAYGRDTRNQGRTVAVEITITDGAIRLRERTQ